MEKDSKEYICNDNEVNVNDCEQLVDIDLENEINDTGRILAVNVELRNLLCNKMLSVGVLVFEGKTLKSFKVKKIYTGKCKCNSYCNTKICKFYFVFPDDNICLPKEYNVRIISNYINYNYC